MSTSIKCIHIAYGDILPVLNETRIQVLTPWFKDNPDDCITLAEAETIYTND